MLLLGLEEIAEVESSLGWKAWKGTRSETCFQAKPPWPIFSVKYLKTKTKLFPSGSVQPGDRKYTAFEHEKFNTENY